ncbi:Na+/H+ antiporter subunit E [Phenylobacterium sp. LjRoot219]|uniref:Na+/H+ antiporter subunit E n=1 Tax=Phenylobacterium sp. LjRoot219 TaxID=3342283 RepID=UPI003ECF6134
MRRWLPYPAMSLFVFATWLVLNQSLAPGHLVLAAALAAAAGFLFVRLDPPPLRIRRRGLLLRLAVRVFGDIVRSNLALLWVLLSGRTSKVTSGFVSIPLQLTNPYGLAVLACIITSTPGTIWMSYRSRDNVLLIHVFDLIDETAWIRTITERYERPLREIFE